MNDIADPETENAEIPGAAEAGSSDETKFQFSSAAALSTARQESLENWHKAFLRGATTSLTDLLRTEFQLTLGSLAIETYGEMVQARGADNQCVLFRMHPQPGVWLLDLPIGLSLALVDRMMGGPGSAPATDKPEMTDLDQSIFQSFAETLLGEYAKNWKPQAELSAEVLRQVRNLNYQIIHQPDELILRVTIDVAFKESKSTMSLIVPITSVEELLLKSLAADETVQAEDKAADSDSKSCVGSVPVPVSIRWQGFQMTLREVDAIALGDVLVLDNKKCENVTIWLADKAKFSGKVSREPQKTTITVTGNLE